MATLTDEFEMLAHELTPDEAWDRFDRAARRYVKMSGAEFTAAWDAGKFAADPDRPPVVRVVMLRPVGR